MPQAHLLHLSYASDLLENSDEAREEIVRVSANNNARLGVTGCIAFDGSKCAQILEGPADVVEALYEKICRDRRHGGIVELVRSPIEELHFDSWGMSRWPIVDLYLLSEQVAAA